MPLRPDLRRATGAAGAGVLLALIVMAGLWLLAPERAEAGVDGDPEAGRELFAANCAACHGPAGRGGGAAPSLVGVTERLGLDLVAQTIRDGRDRMPSFGDRLDEAQIDDLLAHLEQLSASTGPAQRDGSGMSMMHGRWRDRMGEWPVSFALLGLGFVVVTALLVVGIVWLARRASTTSPQHHTAAPPSPARDILDQRYARGEISRQEYLQARRDLEFPD